MTLEKPNQSRPIIRGRGALDNPSGRFERLSLEADPEALEHERFEEDYRADGRQVETEIFRDTSKSIVATNDSPDVGFEASVNAYRGCEHGCIYCFARPSHEYFGLSAGLDFETKIFTKPDAAKLLTEKLGSKSWQPKVVTMSGVTDCYQPLEKKLRLTRQCLEVLNDFRNPAAIITKNFLVTRDVDILADMASWNGISVNMSVTTLDGKLCRVMEPRTSQPKLRLRAIETLAKAGVHVNIMMGPIIPGLTDHEIPAILEAGAAAGASSASYTMLRLPWGVKDLFQSWLQEHYPDRAEKILNRVRAVRGGKLYNAEFGSRMRGEGFYAEQVAHMFLLAKKKHGLTQRAALSTEFFRRDAGSAQMSLF